MGRKPGNSKERHHVHLNPGDWEWIGEVYGPQGLSQSNVIRRIVSSFRRKVSEKIALKMDTTPKFEEIDIDLTNVTADAAGTDSDPESSG